jgi:hypothetical protein
MKVVQISAEGFLSGLHFDDFDLGQFGKKSVSRASEIFFNEHSQLWDILLPSQDRPFPAACGFGYYDQARQFEVKWLQQCMLLGVDADSPEGDTVGHMLRCAAT